MIDVLGEHAEPYESVKLVEQYRRFWKPRNVHTILLAESHVFTSKEDMEYKIKQINGLSGYPTQYAKFVYCLAYGEDSLTQGSNHPAKDGTPQFWKVFHSCANKIKDNASFSPILKSGAQTTERVKNKVKLLKSLRDNGVWLIDTSIMALYNNGKKPSKNVVAKAVKTSWDGYTKNVVKEANPNHVIVIGIGVANSIEKELKNIIGKNYTVIAQPNARLTAEQHLNNYKLYYKICALQ